MSNVDPSTFTVRWADRSDSSFYSIETGTYVATVAAVDWRKSRNDADMAVVKFSLPEVRVGKPKKGRPEGSKEQEVTTQYNRELSNFFMFDLDFQIEAAFNFLVAAGVTTEEELDSNPDLRKGTEVFKLFDKTLGAELALRVQKYAPDKDKNPGALVDSEDNANRIKNFYGKETRQYEVAANATKETIDASQVSFGRKKKG
jgi:hypothetical protein